MTEAPAQTEQKPAEAKPEPALEDLYAEYNVTPEPAPETTKAAPVSEQKPEGDIAAAIHQELAELRRERAAEKQEKLQSRDEADFNQAIDQLRKELGFEGKEKLLRGFLLDKAYADTRFKTLWDQRTKHPEAWKKAISIVGREVREELSIANPQLEENQRAMEESQRTSSAIAPPATTEEQKLLKMPDAEFNRQWMRLARGY